ncbi:MAG TPA: sigma-70 family RNA polymerase sigma factor [Hyphomicrobiaceae bacterium]|nr:sigma-70 family RNA polymerase sigma factor [Hyphomicrobiaceae bacterium]
MLKPRSTAQAAGPTDADLIERIAAQDQTAIEVLFARYQVRVFRFIQRRVRSEAIAEELVNEVFLEVWRSAARFEGRSSLSSWMLSIAHNKAVSLLRKRRESELDDDAAGAIADDADTPEVTAQKTDKGAQLRACMDRLSDDHRAIIDLVYYHEMSIAEVAEVVGIPENTVKTRMFYARKKLSEFLKEAGVDRGWP